MRVFLSLGDILHRVVYNGKGVDLSKQVLTVVVGTHNQGKPWVVIVDPFVISSLKYYPSHFVKYGLRNQHSWEAESTISSFSIFETCGIVVFTMHLTHTWANRSYIVSGPLKMLNDIG
jgi:hypothetical protein